MPLSPNLSRVGRVLVGSGLIHKQPSARGLGLGPLKGVGPSTIEENVSLFGFPFPSSPARRLLTGRGLDAVSRSIGLAVVCVISHR